MEARGTGTRADRRPRHWASAPGRRRSPSAWRRQRRLVQRAGLLALVLGGFLMPVAWGAPAGSIGSVTVRPGETLWSVAVQHYPGMDPRLAVAAIEHANGLSGAVIQPGVHLVLPAA